jgi:uncharacterized protein (TIGR03437 family)
MRFTNLCLISVSFIGLVSAQTPAVADGGVLNAASLVKGQPVALGSFVAIFGSGFGTGGAATSVPWPTSLGGTTVTMNGVPAPLYAVTDGQINAQVPFEALGAGQTSGSVNIVVQRGGQNSAVKSFQVASFAPGIFSIAGNGLGLANASSPDGALAAPAGSVPGYASHPAASGGTIIVLATGLGATDSAVQSGHSSSDALRRTTTLPTVLVGGIQAQVAFSGLSPQFPAVDQLNIVLPVGVASGSSVPIQLSVGGITTTAQLNIAITGTSTSTLSPVTTVLTPASLPKSLAVYGNIAYLCGSQYIGVLDITNPANPKLTATVGTNAFSNVGNLFCYVESGNLIAFADTGSTLVPGTGPSVTTFSLANPAQPVLVNQSPLPRQFVSGLAHRGSTAFATYDSISFSGSTFLNQGGDFISVDVSNPANPKILSALSGNISSGGSGPNIFFDLIAVNDTTIYAASSTSTGSQTASGSGVLDIIDTTDPTNLKLVKQITIPGTRQAATIRIQGNLAVVLSNVEGWRNPIDFTQGAVVGPTNVSTFDITDPRNPVLLTTTTTGVQPALGGNGGAPIGTGQFAFAGTRAGTQNNILLVDARNSQSPQSTTITTPDILRNVFVVGSNYLYALIDNTGLAVYQISN